MASLKNSIIMSWYGNKNHYQSYGFHLLIPFLLLLSLPYRIAVSLKNSLYDSGVLKQKRLSCKAISVGNITSGGTGKTPMTIMLATLLKEAGYRPVVLSRGYGGKTKSPVNLVSDGHHLLMGHDEAGDEPVLIARSAPGIPVLTGINRSLAGKFAIENLGVNVLVLDDAFQHRSLFRDIDVVLLDAVKPLGNGLMLPRGPLREPAANLKRADIILKIGMPYDPEYPEGEMGLPFPSSFHSVPVLQGYRRPKDILQGVTGQVYPLEYLKGKRISAFAGIASPDSFKKTLEYLGAEVVVFSPFSDHHRYTKKNIAEINSISNRAAVELIVTTEKDGVRLIGFPDFLGTIFLLTMEMEILPSRDLLRSMIFDKLRDT